MEETGRMSTAATAAYQAAQVESRIWLSESSTRDSRREEDAKGPHLNTLAWTLARFPHLLGERVCVSPRARERERERDRTLPLLLRLCNNVLTYWST